MERSRFITIALILFSVFTAFNSREIFGLSINEIIILCVIASFIHALAYFCAQRKTLYALSPVISLFLLIICLISAKSGQLNSIFPSSNDLSSLLEQLRSGIIEIKSNTKPFSGNTRIFLVCMVGIWSISEIAETISQKLHLCIPTIGFYTFVNAFFTDSYVISAIIIGSLSWYYIFACNKLRRSSISSIVHIPKKSRLRNTALYTLCGVLIIGTSLIIVRPATDLPTLVSKDTFDFLNFNSRKEVSPLVGMRNLIKSDTNDIMFEVQTDQAQYWRLAVLNSFSDEEWRVSEKPEKDESRPDQLLDGVSFQEISANVTLKNLARKYLPSIYSTQTTTNKDTRFLKGSVLHADNDDIDEYTITAKIPPRSLSQEQIIASSQKPPRSIESSLLIPVDFDPEIINSARKIAENKFSIHEQVVALRDFFLDGSFTYDINADYSKEKNPMKKFLETKRGYCEQFAATYAAMARSIGIPARVIVGFSPGEADNRGIFVIREQQAHSWVEVYLSGFGWLTIEPTPSGDQPGQAPTNIGAVVSTTTTVATIPQSTVPVQSQVPSTTVTKQANDGAEKTNKTFLPFVVVVTMTLLGGGTAFLIRRRAKLKNTNKYIHSTFIEISKKIFARPPSDLTIEELKIHVPTENKSIHIFLEKLAEASYMPNPKAAEEDLKMAAQKARSEKIATKS